MSEFSKQSLSAVICWEQEFYLNVLGICVPSIIMSGFGIEIIPFLGILIYVRI